MNEIQQLKARLEVYHVDNALKSHTILELQQKLGYYEELNELNKQLIKSQSELIGELKTINQMIVDRSTEVVKILSKIGM